MSDTDPPGTLASAAHPLAVALARALAARPAAGRVLLLGVGSGRNIPVLLGSGAALEAIEHDAARARPVEARFADEALRVTVGSYAGPYPGGAAYAAALSTHALLHGREHALANTVAAVHAALVPGGALYATFGSTSDPRCGAGVRIEDRTFAPASGSESGVPHVYFDESALRSLLAGFDIESLVERNASEAVGGWAHSPEEAQAIVHWFVRAFARKARAPHQGAK